ncbi:hypothetical protein F4825DRAFT_457374 [Nemania diffusa]|nr:hypothetical protein F4825DRAFT_457374 [Nemania diffusa]
MFATWKYDPKDNNSVMSAKALNFNPFAAKTIGKKSCSLCRAKKLKCSGERSGCHRCKTLNQVCNYVDTIWQQKRASKSSKNFENTETRKSVSSATSSTVSPLSNPQQQLQHQQQHQNQQHDDFSWLMAQPNIGFATESDLIVEEGTLQHVPFSLGEDLGATVDPSGIVIDLSSPAINARTSPYRSIVPQPSLLGAVDDGGLVAELRAPLSYPAPCQCLYRVVMVMDRLAVQDDCVTEKSLNSVLILAKDALGNSTNMLGCATCMARVENMLTLAILMDKLARLCRRIVHTTTAADSTLRMPATCFGDYKVDSAEEYAALTRSLLGVQLRHLQTRAQSLHNVSLHFHSATLENRLIVIYLSGSIRDPTTPQAGHQVMDVVSLAYATTRRATQHHEPRKEDA